MFGQDAITHVRLGINWTLRPTESTGSSWSASENSLIVRPDGKSYPVVAWRPWLINSLPDRELIAECGDEKERFEWFRNENNCLSKACVFHKGCLKLLIQRFISGGVSLDRLASVVEEAPCPQYRICKSFPRSSSGDFTPPAQLQLIDGNFQVTYSHKPGLLAEDAFDISGFATRQGLSPRQQTYNQINILSRKEPKKMTAFVSFPSKFASKLLIFFQRPNFWAWDSRRKPWLLSSNTKSFGKPAFSFTRNGAISTTCWKRVAKIGDWCIAALTDSDVWPRNYVIVGYNGFIMSGSKIGAWWLELQHLHRSRAILYSKDCDGIQPLGKFNAIDFSNMTPLRYWALIAATAVECITSHHPRWLPSLGNFWKLLFPFLPKMNIHLSPASTLSTVKHHQACVLAMKFPRSRSRLIFAVGGWQTSKFLLEMGASRLFVQSSTKMEYVIV